MKLIIGLGNPEARYDGTRHNLGFMALDYYADVKNAAFKNKLKFLSLVAETTIGSEKVLLVKPTTYYNEAGRAVLALKDFYNLETSDILVVHDDLALPLGTIRTRGSGSDAGNNGIKSVSSCIGPEYARLRIGIRTNLREHVDAANFVLSKLTKDEQAVLQQLTEPIRTMMDDFVAGTLAETSYTVPIQTQKSASE